MHLDNATLRLQFAQVFSPSGRVRIVRAPGRVNLIGEHTDYNEGFVFPMAIEPEVRIACRVRDDGKVRLASTMFPGEVVEFSVDGPIPKAARGHWSNYPRGAAAQLKAAGVPLTGMDALFTNSLPGGGGLSSSAAVEVATAHAFLALMNYSVEPMRLAQLCQKAEHEYAGVPCGIMDQMIVATAKLGHAMLFDCRSFMRKAIAIPDEDIRVVIANSMVKHDLTGADGKSAYATRREQCQAAVAYFASVDPAIKSLRDVSMSMVEGSGGKLDECSWRRARHVVGETQRCQEAAAGLIAKDYVRVGELMRQSHVSLRDDYDVSCAELDFLVEEAMGVRGVYGARMTGGGFGGCIVALTRPEASDHLINHLRTVYKGKYEIDPVVFATRATSGAGVME